MKKALVLACVCLVALFAAGVAFALDSIVNIHVNDANGVPIAPYAIGTAVSIRGIITAEFTTASVTYTRSFIQDETGGINIYKTGTHICFNLGDDVSIEGTIAQYNGLTEVMITSYVINSSGNPLPAPKIMTVPELIATMHGDYTEPDEGRLIKIGNVTIPGASGNWASKNYSITDGAYTDTLYVYGGAGCAAHPLIGTPLPLGQFCVVGILTQFDNNAPYLSGYQISPRVVPDIVLGQTPVQTTTWGRIKAMFD